MSDGHTYKWIPIKKLLKTLKWKFNFIHQKCFKKILYSVSFLVVVASSLDLSSAYTSTAAVAASVVAATAAVVSAASDTYKEHKSLET